MYITMYITVYITVYITMYIPLYSRVGIDSEVGRSSLQPSICTSQTYHPAPQAHALPQRGMCMEICLY